MNIYLCNTPVLFPRSEYGGMVAVMANSKKRLGKILTERYSKNEHFFDLRISVESCKEIKLDPAVSYGEGIVMEFLT
jgi:hypothetical protein